MNYLREHQVPTKYRHFRGVINPRYFQRHTFRSLKNTLINVMSSWQLRAFELETPCGSIK